jgi:hypothetical protein
VQYNLLKAFHLNNLHQRIEPNVLYAKRALLPRAKKFGEAEKARMFVIDLSS